jgi:alanine-glyoxylate transaminase/serine-glyoxylate transaminase/serine-pyruvate transaminase
MSATRGWQFFMHPGPTNVPHRVVRAMQRPMVDFTGPEFVALRDRCLERLKGVLKTKVGFPIVYASSGNGAWDASIANVFSPGDKVLVPQTGFFADRWANTARAYGIEVEAVAIPERRTTDPEVIARPRRADRQEGRVQLRALRAARRRRRPHAVELVAPFDRLEGRARALRRQYGRVQAV